MRRAAAATLWVLCGLGWVVIAFVSWAQSGPLSRSSLADLAGLVRSGVLTSLPGWLPAVVIVLPLVGALLVGLALPRTVTWVRPVLLVVAGSLWFGITREVTGSQVGRWGVGPWLGLCALGLGAVAFTLDLVDVDRRRRR
ncbi:hypothetical protein [Nocardioides alcanivorans]|uniref:hypothetical protein n=1 Tax=Nocardioides alcanivorans TaxID=2897352 RepID=UPI001F3C5E24|nr:hypothetical protein [Nocardioides alcanivorans]